MQKIFAFVLYPMFVFVIVLSWPGTWSGPGDTFKRSHAEMGCILWMAAAWTKPPLD